MSHTYFFLAILCLSFMKKALKFAGKWYRVGVAYDSPSFVPFRSKIKASMGTIAPLPNGNANLTMWEATPFGCVSKKYQYERASVPGQFTYFSARHNMVKDITVVETNYTDYAMVLKHKVFNREYTQAALYGETRSQMRLNMQKFKTFALSRGLPRESIVIPPPAGEARGNTPPFIHIVYTHLRAC
uniref:Prostaglandin D2 synthase a n=1 Tax=Oreochromis niloticus TaxID=8128 RepID=A0A669D5Q7_ORENI